MNKDLEIIKNYLKDRINNSWYSLASEDYGITGSFVDANVINGHDLEINWKEENKNFSTTIYYYKDYNCEQLYNIWMESDWLELQSESLKEKDQLSGMDI